MLKHSFGLNLTLQRAIYKVCFGSRDSEENLFWPKFDIQNARNDLENKLVTKI